MTPRATPTGAVRDALATRDCTPFRAWTRIKQPNEISYVHANDRVEEIPETDKCMRISGRDHCGNRGGGLLVNVDETRKNFDNFLRGAVVKRHRLIL